MSLVSMNGDYVRSHSPPGATLEDAERALLLEADGETRCVVKLAIRSAIGVYAPPLPLYTIPTMSSQDACIEKTHRSLLIRDPR